MSFTSLFALPSAISILLSRLSGLGGHVSPPQLKILPALKAQTTCILFLPLIRMVVLYIALGSSLDSY